MTQYNNLGGSPISALFRKYTMGRIVIGGGVGTDSEGKQIKKKSWSSPTIAQMLVIFSLFLITTFVAVLGDNEILSAPCLFSGSCVDSSYLNSNLLKNTLALNQSKVETSLPLTAEPVTPLKRHLSHQRFTRHKRDVPPPVTKDQPKLIRVGAGWWVTADRVGLIAYAILPICISFALKQVS